MNPGRSPVRDIRCVAWRPEFLAATRRRMPTSARTRVSRPVDGRPGEQKIEGSSATGGNEPMRQRREEQRFHESLPAKVYSK
jgi:hypothetical protein